MTQPILSWTIIHEEVEQGLDFILSHLTLAPPKSQLQSLFPRTIMTQLLGYQMIAYSRENVIREFEVSNWRDCRINAYAYASSKSESVKIVLPLSFIMIDLDKGNDKSKEELDKDLNSTLRRISKLLDGAKSTVLWTGNGYHIYLPVDAFVLEEDEYLVRLVNSNKKNNSSSNVGVGSEFLRFAERYLANGKHDREHRPTVNSCLIRIPGTFNSKNGQQVIIVQKWDGKRANIQPLLREFRCAQIQKQLDEIITENRRKREESKLGNNTISLRHEPKSKNHSNSNSNNNSPNLIWWIENLLKISIDDYRKYCCWRILAPYFVNVRKMSEDESRIRMLNWLEKCGCEKRMLSFNAESRVSYDVRSAMQNGFYPISLDNLQKENPVLCHIIQALMMI